MGLSNAYTTPIGMSPYQLIYWKSCHLPIELENKPMLVIEEAKLRLGATSTQRVNELNLLDEFRLKAYESAALYKKR